MGGALLEGLKMLWKACYWKETLATSSLARGVVAVEEMERRGPGEKGKRKKCLPRQFGTIWMRVDVRMAREQGWRHDWEVGVGDPGWGQRGRHAGVTARPQGSRAEGLHSLLRRQRVGRWLRRGFDERWLCTTEDWVAVVAGQAIEAMTVTVAAVSVVSSTKVVSGEAQL
ncbi:hypothetical protein GW17_00009668 [Ensete ventricosum]|nr:hypothetical protein GW17_00009668 [Ensete ventricosum]